MEFVISRKLDPFNCTWIDYKYLKQSITEMIDEMEHKVNALKHYERIFEISAEIYGEISHGCFPIIDYKNHTIMGIQYVVKNINEMPSWTISLLYDDKESRETFEIWNGYGSLTAQIEKNALNSIFGKDGIKSMKKLKITKVIFNYPATIVFWNDGTKTVVKCGIGDTFDPEKGLAMAYMKKSMGNKGNYFNEVKKWVDPYIKEEK